MDKKLFIFFTSAVIPALSFFLEREVNKTGSPKIGQFSSRVKREFNDVVCVCVGFPRNTCSLAWVIGFAAPWWSKSWTNAGQVDDIISAKPFHLSIFFFLSDETAEKLLKFCNSRERNLFFLIYCLVIKIRLELWRVMYSWFATSDAISIHRFFFIGFWTAHCHVFFKCSFWCASVIKDFLRCIFLTKKLSRYVRKTVTMHCCSADSTKLCYYYFQVWV